MGDDDEWRGAAKARLEAIETLLSRFDFGVTNSKLDSLETRMAKIENRIWLMIFAVLGWFVTDFMDVVAALRAGGVQ